MNPRVKRKPPLDASIQYDVAHVLVFPLNCLFRDKQNMIKYNVHFQILNLILFPYF